MQGIGTEFNRGPRSVSTGVRGRRDPAARGIRSATTLQRQKSYRDLANTSTASGRGTTTLSASSTNSDASYTYTPYWAVNGVLSDVDTVANGGFWSTSYPVMWAIYNIGTVAKDTANAKPAFNNGVPIIGGYRIFYTKQTSTHCPRDFELWGSELEDPSLHPTNNAFNTWIAAGRATPPWFQLDRRADVNWPTRDTPTGANGGRWKTFYVPEPRPIRSLILWCKSAVGAANAGIQLAEIEFLFHR